MTREPGLVSRESGAGSAGHRPAHATLKRRHGGAMPQADSDQSRQPEPSSRSELPYARTAA